MEKIRGKIKKKEVTSSPSRHEKGKKNSQKYLEMSLEVVEAMWYNQSFKNLNFRSPFMNDINEKPIPKGLKGPKVQSYDGIEDPDNHVSNFQWAI